MNKIISALSTTLLFSSVALSVNASNINYQNLVDDVTVLASDEMEGRRASTPGIKKAANYIAKRFEAIGLKPLKGEGSFKQSFSLYKIVPNKLKVNLAENLINANNIMVLSSYENLNWSNKDNIKQLHIGEKDDFRKQVFAINQNPENLLVTVDPAHQGMFNNFKNYFGRGLTKFKKNNGPSAVFVLSKNTQVKSFSVSVKSKIETIEFANVAGILPGKTKPNEKVLFSAHYDHLGISFKEKDDKIFNGADDDASGTSAVINLAEYFAKKNDNQRTLVFVAFTAEEMGGYGSQYFSKQLKPDNITAMINIEMIGKESVFGSGSFWMTGFDRSNLGEILNQTLKQKGLEVHPDPYPAQNLFYRSDNATLARLGVPAHSFSSTQIDKDLHYHKTSDDISTLDFKSMHKVVEGLSQAVESLVDGSKAPTRVDTSAVTAKGFYF